MIDHMPGRSSLSCTRSKVLCCRVTMRHWHSWSFERDWPKSKLALLYQHDGQSGWETGVVCQCGSMIWSAPIRNMEVSALSCFLACQSMWRHGRDSALWCAIGCSQRQGGPSHAPQSRECLSYKWVVPNLVPTLLMPWISIRMQLPPVSSLLAAFESAGKDSTLRSSVREICIQKVLNTCSVYNRTYPFRGLKIIEISWLVIMPWAVKCDGGTQSSCACVRPWKLNKRGDTSTWADNLFVRPFD